MHCRQHLDSRGWYHVTRSAVFYKSVEGCTGWNLQVSFVEVVWLKCETMRFVVDMPMEIRRTDAVAAVIGHRANPVPRVSVSCEQIG